MYFCQLFQFNPHQLYKNYLIESDYRGAAILVTKSLKLRLYYLFIELLVLALTELYV